MKNTKPFYCKYKSDAGQPVIIEAIGERAAAEIFQKRSKGHTNTVEVWTPWAWNNRREFANAEPAEFDTSDFE